ncbi:Phenylacetic acid catabolic protein [Thermus scotoductus]|uniref:Phenylacetic acid catabolic protein n=1 Tax=Thermus scotoductus TaxID=37636 RepID=UPI0020A56A6A|nr:Phenylacetic acid catabolic protein [Thermus scotoductus]
MAQDELGHAKVWLELQQELNGSDPDRLFYFRAPLAFQNAILVELPKGDWAFTMVRQYLFHPYHNLWLNAPTPSSSPPPPPPPRPLLHPHP